VRTGLTIPFQGVDLSQLPALVRLVEAAGYDSLWSEESVNFDGITPLAVAATSSERLRLVSGVVNVFTRGPALLAQTAAALAELSNGRFVLGLGTSSDVIVEQWNGIPFARPLEKTRATLLYLRSVLAGERGPGGFRLPRPPERPVPLVLAALRPRMLQLAADLADGAFTNFLPLSGVRAVVTAFGVGDKELACRFFSVPGPEDAALSAARRLFTAYATVPVYSDFLRWLGWSEAIAPVAEAWASGDRKRAMDLVPEALLRETFLFGPYGAQRERLAAFADAGITTAVIVLMVPPSELSPGIEAFAPG
jgi:probable F420-dependent oxidoreductase